MINVTADIATAIVRAPIVYGFGGGGKALTPTLRPTQTHPHPPSHKKWGASICGSGWLICGLSGLRLKATEWDQNPPEHNTKCVAGCAAILPAKFLWSPT